MEESESCLCLFIVFEGSFIFNSYLESIFDFFCRPGQFIRRGLHIDKNKKKYHSFPISPTLAQIRTCVTFKDNLSYILKASKKKIDHNKKKTEVGRPLKYNI